MLLISNLQHKTPNRADYTLNGGHFVIWGSIFKRSRGLTGVLFPFPLTGTSLTGACHLPVMSLYPSKHVPESLRAHLKCILLPTILSHCLINCQPYGLQKYILCFLLKLFYSIFLSFFFFFFFLFFFFNFFPWSIFLFNFCSSKLLQFAPLLYLPFPMNHCRTRRG